MFRTKLIAATLGAALALGTTSMAYAGSNRGEEMQEAATILGAKASVLQAVVLAEKHTGGRALKIGLEREDGAYRYEVKVVTKDKVSEVTIDPASGTVTRVEDDGRIARLLDREDKAAFGELVKSPVTLSTAIETAENETGGKAIEAEWESEDGKPELKVETVKGDVITKSKNRRRHRQGPQNFES
tara:strand:- start:1560 stop:2117 length:558 start_codon:yes stop_codon:yes gene_type:complete